MIYEKLPIGDAKPITARELADYFHVGIRFIVETIEKERREGYPICATCDYKNPGYYIAANREEMLSYCMRLSHRVNELQKTRLACLRSLANIPPN